MTIEKTENIVKKIGFDISQTKWKDNLENEEQPIYELYEDSELRYALELHMYYKEKRQEIIIKPSGQDMQIFSKEQKRLEEANEWGNLGKYYLVQYIDLETGKEQVINILV